jgi:hypothetical protein
MSLKEALQEFKIGVMARLASGARLLCTRIIRRGSNPRRF